MLQLLEAFPLHTFLLYLLLVLWSSAVQRSNSHRTKEERINISLRWTVSSILRFRLRHVVSCNLSNERSRNRGSQRRPFLTPRWPKPISQLRNWWWKMMVRKAALMPVQAKFGTTPTTSLCYLYRGEALEEAIYNNCTFLFNPLKITQCSQKWFF